MSPPQPKTDPKVGLKHLEEFNAKLTAVTLEMDRRIKAGTFMPGPGLTLKGTEEDQRTFLKMVRREMATSPSFFRLMQTVNAKKPAVEISVGRNQVITIRGVKHPTEFDSFDSDIGAGQQELDLADITGLPVNPPPDFPHATTQGEVLAHAIAEAHAGVQGDEYDPAHAVGVDAQNDYRDDRGQSGHMTPEGVARRNGNFIITYDNGYWEVWVMERGSLKKVDRHAGLPPQPATP